MNKWSDISKKRLDQVHPVLQFLMNRVLPHRDISIVCGSRTREMQRILVDRGASKTMNSRHIPRDGEKLARAVDIKHCPYEGAIREELTLVAGLVFGIAIEHGIPIGKQWLRWGGDWNANLIVQDNGFDDLFHFEWNGPYDYEI